MVQLDCRTNRFDTTMNKKLSHQISYMDEIQDLSLLLTSIWLSFVKLKKILNESLLNLLRTISMVRYIAEQVTKMQPLVIEPVQPLIQPDEQQVSQPLPDGCCVGFSSSFTAFLSKQTTPADKLIILQYKCYFDDDEKSTADKLVSVIAIILCVIALVMTFLQNWIAGMCCLILALIILIIWICLQKTAESQLSRKETKKRNSERERQAIKQPLLQSEIIEVRERQNESSSQHEGMVVENLQ